MGVRGALLRAAAGRPPALVVTAPGGTAARLAVEAAMRRRGWPAAASPAGASALVTCGDPSPGLAAAVDRTWDGLPGPRVCVEVRDPGDAHPALTDAERRLADEAAQRADARARGAPDRPGGMEDMPAGLPMAEAAEDRDGLMLDQLSLPLGPVLPHWPGGLVVEALVQGDVVQAASCAVEGGPVGHGPPFWDRPWLGAEGAGRARTLAAAHLDSAGRLLALAGRADEAMRAARIRDGALAGDDVAAGAGRLARRVRRSWLLAAMLRDVGRIDPATAEGLELRGPAAAGGDVLDRLLAWLDGAAAALSGPGTAAVDPPRGPLGDGPPPSRALLDAIEAVLPGMELAAARLLVASLDPDPDELVGARVPEAARV